MNVGQSKNRVDAFDKVTGRAKYTGDFFENNMLVAKVLHSSIAHGMVKSMDTSAAEAMDGVEGVFTCFDVPDIPFPTAGHPWSVEPAHQDVADRHLLAQHVRFYGDDIAVVVARDEITAKHALKAIRVEYEELPPLLSVPVAMAEGAPLLHEKYKGNVLASTSYALGDFDAAIQEDGLVHVTGTYHLPTVQHCHIENAISIAYMEQGRIVVISSTQIPHIVRRVVGQALGIPWGRVRVIKPYIGGGFGNKQEVLYEPLAAFLTSRLGGRPVKVETTREETFANTRVRHAADFTIHTYVRQDGTLVARSLEGYSNQGAYASHGHAIIANSSNTFRHLYRDEGGVKSQVSTVFTNLPTGGAMRGYGIPQIIFAMEAHMDDVAHAIGMDPIELRRKNMMQEGYVDPLTGIANYTNGLEECIRKGKEFIGWDAKRAAYANQSGEVRRGVGMALFSYKTGVYPISLETASCRMTLNQDGSIQLMMGATEIGQGADTVFSQMAADAVGVAFENVHIISSQDTDVAPFDTGAYASRQTYVSGAAVKDTGLLLRQRILEYAEYLLHRPAAELDLKEGQVVEKSSGLSLLPLEELAMEAYYSLDKSVHLTAECTHHCKDNTFSLGACFAEVEVDIPLGKVKILHLINVHDCGILINPKLAEMQVHGGMSMGIGYALYEQLLFDEKTGRPLNNNLLDYKLMTAEDTPELRAEFVELNDPSAPFGNKALGEPPAIPVAPAIRNAVFHATGVAVDSIPMTPQRLIPLFKAHGLLK